MHTVAKSERKRLSNELKIKEVELKMKEEVRKEVARDYEVISIYEHIRLCDHVYLDKL
jgi:hypothetical protein